MDNFHVLQQTLLSTPICKLNQLQFPRTYLLFNYSLIFAIEVLQLSLNLDFDGNAPVWASKNISTTICNFELHLLPRTSIYFRPTPRTYIALQFTRTYVWASVWSGWKPKLSFNSLFTYKPPSHIEPPSEKLPDFMHDLRSSPRPQSFALGHLRAMAFSVRKGTKIRNRGGVFGGGRGTQPR